jgi:hypothetical protein
MCGTVRSIVSSDRVGRGREQLPTYSTLLFAVSHLMVSSVNVPALAGIRTYIGACFTSARRRCVLTDAQPGWPILSHALLMCEPDATAMSNGRRQIYRLFPVIRGAAPSDRVINGRLGQSPD